MPSLHWYMTRIVFNKFNVGRYLGCQCYSLLFERYKLQFEHLPFILSYWRQNYFFNFSTPCI